MSHRTPWCLPLTRLSGSDLAVAGGKGANLGELLAAGFDVPPGFVVTTDAYRRAVTGLAAPSLESVRAVGIPPEVRDAVLAAYSRLDGGPVAVRSSATAEDLPGAAFAGQQDTFLNVRGEQDLLDAVRRCWASLWTDRAIAYRQRLGIDPATVAIAVVVQAMVPADHAGVMFTADPVTGARDRVVIDSNPGLGEAVVAGLVTPDHAVVDSGGTVVERRAGRRELVVRTRAGGGTETRPGGSDGAGEPSLGDADLARLARTGRRIAAHFARPQDIEWALAAGRLAILQARPMTALPPAPLPLNRRQRLLGPVIVELLPRRPTPLETSAWILTTVGRHVEVLLDGFAGLHLAFTDILPARDGVVQAFVPPDPQPTARTPWRLLRTVARMGRDPRDWVGDPVRARYLAEAGRLAAVDVTAASWQELLGIPVAATRLAVMIADVRAAYLPATVGALVRLRLLLTLLRHRELLKDLVVDAPTATQEANTELAELARLIRGQPALAAAATDPATDGAQLLHLLEHDLEHDTAAAQIRTRLAAFLDRFGHRETTSILLPRDPTWSDAPDTVLALVKVLVGERTRPRSEVSSAALDRLLAHRAIRAGHAGERVRRLVARTAAGIAMREDTHFEATRPMPAVHRALWEIGRRLTAAGAIADPDDVWYLTWPEVSAINDPQTALPHPGLRRSVQRRRDAFAELAGSPLIATTTLYPGRDAGGNALVRGVGGGGGRASGTVRVVHGLDEFATLKPGEILVCPATNPSWTPLFARAAAVVVDNGGLASHAAIVAREYGIPAVMGCGTATATLTDGMPVLVDGDVGTVRPVDGVHHHNAAHQDSAHRDSAHRDSAHRDRGRREP